MYPDEYRNSEDDAAIYWFSSPFDALNNWSAHIVEVWRQKFMTLEHAYHFAKFEPQSHAANEILNAKSPWESKQLASKYKSEMVDNWHDVKVEVMEELFRHKVQQNKDVKEILLKTGDRKIYENSPVDSFWGVGKDGNGENIMGKIQMKVRDELLERA